MAPEIFKGKEAKNNRMILKALYEKGYLSAWQIANEIVVNCEKKPTADHYHKAQKINSVLVRKKNGRLADLIKKEFIEKTEKCYCLTFDKGFCSALTLYEEIPKPAIDKATKIAAFLPELRDFLDAMIRYQPQAQIEGLKIMQEITNDLLNKGLNLELISNNEFNRFFAAQYEELQLKELKKAKKIEEKRELPPELKEASQRFISRLVGIAKQEFKELEELSKNYSQSDSKK
jgi:hypothetical protein